MRVFENLALSAPGRPFPISFAIALPHPFSILFIFCLYWHPVPGFISRLYLYRVCDLLPVSKEFARAREHRT